MRKGQWTRAAKFSAAVLEKYPDDVETLVLVAQVAHENQQPDRSADLLLQACRLESFGKMQRVQQAMIAMIGVGRLYEGMEMLEEAVQRHPDQHDTRRWLYDFYMGTENRPAALPHGRFLVRKRKFDLQLLLSLSNTERRTQDPKPLEEMIERNPEDSRPQVGNAKVSFDEGDYR
ncbi:MAG: RNA-binding protein, partial [Pirellulales bacterium]|nr:RNA-binding protein [Pirellulales bacterium]